MDRLVSMENLMAYLVQFLMNQEKLTCRNNICQCEENEKFENDECKEKCPIGTLIFDDQCFHFSTQMGKWDKGKNYCEDLNINSHNDWRIAIIKDSSTNIFLKEYLQSIGNTEIYWLSKREKKSESNLYDDEWKDYPSDPKIDYSFCPLANINIKTEPMHYRIDCFYDSITDDNKDLSYKYICLKTF
ncbi:hypothetical protein BpHYR1_025240 [Brachionus plicatilis]|uniref:C-type lectin domain-containing protein n=1 Tax=Brachionus plicatilis TaxID=10195 RepID=A0A3M7TBP5_BRAPC|nr:hypothetical protein BpHYR1_025240 [Brachionus plicatilis]